MSATVLLVGFVAFAGCLAVHIVLWRVARPRSDMRALFAVFFGVPCAVALLLAAPGGVGLAGFPDWLDVAAALLLHWALSSAYVQTYPAIQAMAPSLEIASAVRRSMPGGVARSDLLVRLNTRALVEERIEDLVADRLVRMEGGRFMLTPASKGLVRFFLGLRVLLGLPRRGG